MKVKILLVALLSLFVLIPASAISTDDFRYAYGQWEMEEGRLVQRDLMAGMARVDIPVDQQGKVIYDFNVRYEDGGTEDLHAGFGIHIFVDSPAKGKAWGNDKSYLLWLNYDVDPSGITSGLSAQVYKSLSHHEMELVADFDLNKFAPLLTMSNQNITVPVRMEVNGNTGDVRISDPVREGWVYKFNLGNSAPLNGRYISLRTNSGSFSFGM